MIHERPNRMPGDFEQETIRFHLDHPKAVLPHRNFAGDAGFDLSVCEDTEIPPNRFVDIPCGIRMALPGNLWARVCGRSSTLRKWGLHVVEGVIDSGYRGPIFTGVWNLNQQPVTVHCGARLAQVIPHLNIAVMCRVVGVDQQSFESIENDGRGESGFGSTGV